MLKIFKFTVIMFAVLSVSFANSYANTRALKTDIKGKIIEKSNKESLPYATVTIINADGKVVSGATTSENGDFNLSAVVEGDYKLLVSFIGFKDKEIPLQVGDSSLDLGKIEIELDSEQLSAAVVTAKVPLIEQKLDKIVMNVSESVMATTSNGYEILRKAPGISVDKDGNVLLNGQAVEIWVDGRPSRVNGTQLEVFLSALDGNTIEKIEIMQHPSAKYDASGSGGIINIKTKKSFIKGFYGNVSANYTMYPYSEFHQGFNGSVNLNYRSEKTNTYISYTPRYFQGRNSFNSETFYGSDYQNKQVSDNLLGGTNKNNYVKFGQDLYINDKNTIGYLVAGKFSDFTMNSNYSDIYNYEDGNLVQKAISDIKQGDKTNNLDANLYYTHKFNDISELTMNLDYNYFDVDNYSMQRNKYYNPDTHTYTHAFTSDAKQYINIISGKIDYKNKLFKKGVYETGLKYTKSITDNNLVRRDSLLNDYEINNKLSNDFIYTEDIAAAYISASYQFSPKWSAMAGLRGEYTHTKGDWKSADTTTKQNYFDLFPTVFVGYNPAQDWRLSLSYTMRIERPRFMQLNPFRMYIDADSYVEGNPQLDPQYAHQLSLNAGYKRYFNFGLMLSHTTNFITQDPVIDQQTGGKAFKWLNFGSQTMYGVTASISELPIVNDVLFFSFNGFYSQAKVKSGNYKKSAPFYQLNGTLTAVLPAAFKLELSGFYMGKFPYGYMCIQPMHIVNLGIKKSILKDKATISLSFDDIFNGSNTKIKTYDGDVLTYNLDQRQFGRSIKLGFNWKFGQMQAKARSNKRDDTGSRVGGGSSL